MGGKLRRAGGIFSALLSLTIVGARRLAEDRLAPCMPLGEHGHLAGAWGSRPWTPPWRLLFLGVSCWRASHPGQEPGRQGTGSPSPLGWAGLLSWAMPRSGQPKGTLQPGGPVPGLLTIGRVLKP